MKSFILPIAIEGIPFIGAAFFLALIFWFLNVKWLSLLFWCIGFFVLYFFRDPERFFESDENMVISPADGKVVFIGKVMESEFSNELMIKISIFMSIFDVHVNRSPFDLFVREVKYRKGTFFSADKNKSSDQNERNLILFETKSGTRIIVAQVAGFIARRIVFYPKIGAFLRKGERFGLIRFGSRVDIFLPKESEVVVKTGQKVFGGKTIIAKLFGGKIEE